MGIFSLLYVAALLLYKKRFLLYYISSVIIILFFTVLGLEIKNIKVDNESVSSLFFFIILPCTNGAMDFISFLISRILGRKIEKDEKICSFLWHFAIDFIAAVTLLVLLIFGITFLTEIFNILIIKNPKLMINLPEIIENAKAEPWGAKGLWITLMLISTLIPTFSHFIIAFVGAYTLYFTPAKIREAIALKIEQKKSPQDLTLSALYFALKYPLCVAVGIGFWTLLIFFLNKFMHVAAKLSDVAYAGIDFAEYIIR